MNRVLFSQLKLIFDDFNTLMVAQRDECDSMELRRLFMTRTDAQVRKMDPFVSLVDLTKEPKHIQKTSTITGNDLLVFKKLQRHNVGQPVFHPDAYERKKFRRRWAEMFPELAMPPHLWKNVVAAGGAVLRAIRADAPGVDAHMDNHGADVDLFLWGLTQKQAEAKIKAIHDYLLESRRRADPHCEVRILRTDRALTILSRWPQPHVQIILRLYRIPAEVPIGFDIDCCAAMYDGDRVRVEKRLIRSLVYGYNVADPDRLSPQYESRLRKYAQRGMAVRVPLDKPVDAEATRRVERPSGLAKLLQMEARENEKASPTRWYRSRRFLRTYKWQLAQLIVCAIVWQTLPVLCFYASTAVAVASVGIKMEEMSQPRVHWKYHENGGSGAAKLARGAGVLGRLLRVCGTVDRNPTSASNANSKRAAENRPAKTSTIASYNDPYVACARWVYRRLNKRPPSEHLFVGDLKSVLTGRNGKCRYCRCDLDRLPPRRAEDKWHSGPLEWITINPGRQYMSGSIEPLDPEEWLRCVRYAN